jgi:MFS family permease
MTWVHWMIVILAAIGFAFDIYVLLMLPLIVRPALQELLGAQPGSPTFKYWVALLFYVPAVAGGIFGLLGGYLTDRLGRRRVLTWSILLYAAGALASAYATSAVMLLILRCACFIGVSVEFVAAVAWLAELFPNPHQRETVLGYTQAFSSFGGLLVAIANGIAVKYAGHFPAISLPELLPGLGGIAAEHQHEAWRYTLLSGFIPAIPLALIRPFLPESPQWQRKKQTGTLRRPSIAALFAPALRRTTVVTTIMFACSYGAAFGALQHIPQIVPGLADVRAKTQGQPAPVQRNIEQRVGSEYTKMQEFGGLVGRFLLALLAVRILSRRALLWTFQLPGLIVVPLVFYFFLTVDNRTFFVIPLSSIYLGDWPVTTVTVGVFLAGLFTVAQFSFWGNYLPRVYPMHLRGTGESVAANIGGRLIGTSFAAVTTLLSGQEFMPGETPAAKLAYSAAAVGLFVYAVGFIASFFLPEPKAVDLPD